VGSIHNQGALTLTHSLIESNSGEDWYVLTSVNESAPGTTRLSVGDCIIRDNIGFPGVLALDGYAQVWDAEVSGHNTITKNGDIINIWGSAVEVDLTNVLVAGNDSARPTLNGNNSTSQIALMNVTVAGNSVENFPIVAGDGNWTLTNTIVWGNTAPEDMMGLGTFVVGYSDIEYGWPGTGNLDVDPRFSDPAAGDYRLSVASPVKDKGTATGAPDHDLDGADRPQGGGFDLGAYEWKGNRVLLPIILREN
jgi:hypothetical protein